MPIFPHILARTAAFSYEEIAMLTLPNMTAYTSFEQEQKKIQKLAEKTIKAIKIIHFQTQNAQLKPYLYYLKAKIFAQKSIDVAIQKPAFLQLPAHLAETFLIYNNQINRVLQIYKNLKYDFEEAKHTHLKQLLARCQKPDYLNALLLSSHVFLTQWQKISLENIAEIRKKQAQLIRTALQYLTRACTKTTPFGSFATLSVLSLDENEPILPVCSHVRRLNNQVFEYLKDILLAFPSFYAHLPVQLNTHLRFENNTFKFLFRTKNIESIQTIDNNDALQLVYKLFLNKKKPIIYQDLLILLSKYIDDAAQCEAFIQQLLQFGFLVWHWNIKNTDANWANKLYLKITQLPDFQHKNDFLYLLESLQQSITTVWETWTLEERLAALKKNYAKLQDFNNLFLKYNKKQNLQLIDFENFKIINYDKIPFRAEELFYEDSATAPMFHVEHSEIEPVLQSLKNLLFLTKTIVGYKQNNDILCFFKHHFDILESVDLLFFYEQFYKNGVTKNSFDLEEFTEKEGAFLNNLLPFISTKKEIIDINLNLFFTYNQQFTKKNKINISVLLQFYEKKGRKYAVLNGTTIGYGKLFARFLPLFNDTLYKKLCHKNIVLNDAENEIWAENTDGSFFNANDHWPLLTYKIGTEEDEIKIDDLEVKYNIEENSLELWHKIWKKRVRIFDFGLEWLGNRSAMYRLLSCFGPKIPPASTLNRLLNKKYMREISEGVKFYSRIVIDNQLVIQRKTWHISRQYLPLKTNDMSDFDYFLKIQTWRRSLHLPKEVFIVVNPHEISLTTQATTAKDDYKYQFIDFENILLINLFAKLLARVCVYLKIEEMLPAPKHLSYIEKKRYATEWVVQM